MAKAKGTPKTGGRQKGAKNKDPLALEERARNRGVDVFEIALDFASANYKALGYENECYFTEKPDGAVKMGYVISPEMRLKAVETLMKYIYPQKKALEVSNPEGQVFEVRVLDFSSKAK